MIIGSYAFQNPVEQVKTMVKSDSAIKKEQDKHFKTFGGVQNNLDLESPLLLKFIK